MQVDHQALMKMILTQALVLYFGSGIMHQSIQSFKLNLPGFVWVGGGGGGDVGTWN